MRLAVCWGCVVAGLSGVRLHGWQGRWLERFIAPPIRLPLSDSRPLFCDAAHVDYLFYALAGSCHSRLPALTFVGSMRWGMRVLPTSPCVIPGRLQVGGSCAHLCMRCCCRLWGGQAEGESTWPPPFILAWVRGILRGLAYCTL